MIKGWNSGNAKAEILIPKLILYNNDSN